MQTIVETQNLTFGYPKEDDTLAEVLHGIDLSIEQGQFVAVLGHNGSGKSTLAKHFNAILLPSGGKVIVAGFDTMQEDKLYEIRQNVGMVFQNPDNQIVATIVEEDVAFALENLGIEPKEIRRRVDEALQAVGMYEYRGHAPHQISGGQKQRVAIAGIIAMRPQCIVLDEPTAMLDPRGRKEVLRTIKQLKEEFGITIVLITHYMEEAVQADRVVVVDNGSLLLDGTPREVFSHVRLLKEVGLDVPQATELIYELQREGVSFPDGILTADECVNAIVNWIGGDGHVSD